MVSCSLRSILRLYCSFFCYDADYCSSFTWVPDFTTLGTQLFPLNILLRMSAFLDRFTCSDTQAHTPQLDPDSRAMRTELRETATELAAIHCYSDGRPNPEIIRGPSYKCPTAAIPTVGIMISGHLFHTYPSQLRISQFFEGYHE